MVRPDHEKQPADNSTRNLWTAMSPSPCAPGGGHSLSAGHANIDGGVLVSLDNLNEVACETATGLLSLGPGARWDDVDTVLDDLRCDCCRRAGHGRRRQAVSCSGAASPICQTCIVWRAITS